MLTPRRRTITPARRSIRGIVPIRSETEDQLRSQAQQRQGGDRRMLFPDVPSETQLDVLFAGARDRPQPRPELTERERQFALEQERRLRAGEEPQAQVLPEATRLDRGRVVADRPPVFETFEQRQAREQQQAVEREQVVTTQIEGLEEQVALFPEFLQDDIRRDIQQRLQSVFQRGPTGELLAGAAAFHEDVIIPLAALATVGIAKLPGENPVFPEFQSLERRFNENRANGMAIEDAARDAYANTDLPPGVKGLAEVVVDPLLLLPGVGFGGAIARGSTVLVRKVGRTQAVRMVRQASQEMAELARTRVQVAGRELATQRGAVRLPGKAAEEAGQADAAQLAAAAERTPDLPSPPEPPGTAVAAAGGGDLPPIVAKVNRMWEEPSAPKPSLGQRLRQVKVTFERNVTDRFAEGNRQAGIARKEWRASTGENLPAQLDFEIQASLLGGVDAAGIQRFNDAARRAGATLGNDIAPDLLDTYLHLKHSISIVEAKGSQRKIAGGIQGIAEARQGLDEMAASLGPERMARLESAAGEWQGFTKELLERDIAEGFVTRETFDLLQEMYPWYNPIRYQDDLMNTTLGGGGRSFSSTRSGLRRLSEEGSEEARERPTVSLLRHAVASERRVQQNRVAKALVRDLQLDPEVAPQIKRVSGVRPVAQLEGQPIFRRPSGEIRGTISVMEGGTRVVYEVPEWAERMAKGMSEANVGEMGPIIRAFQAPFRSVFVTYNPAFMAAQGMFDMVTVAATRGVMPWESGWAMLRNLKAIVKSDPEFARIMRSKAAVLGWHGENPQSMIRGIEKQGNLILRSSADWRRLMQAPWKTIRQIGEAIEMGPRRAVFERGIRAGLSEDEAAVAFRRATVDFQRIGTSMRLANQLFLFLNPATQGALLPFRALRDGKIARYGIAGLVGLQLTTYAWNRQFEEYKDIPLFDKYGGLIVMLPSEEFDRRGNKVPHYIKVIPMLREFAAFTAPMTFLLGKMDETAPESVGQFFSEVSGQLNPFSKITGQGGLPVPTQLGETLVEVGLNRDTFRDRPIVPLELQGLPADQQFDARTSEVARRLGRFLNWSPMKIDHVIQSGVGRDILLMLDSGIRAIAGGEDPRIEGLVEQLREIQETVAPADVPLERRRFIASLSAEDARLVLEGERKPEPKVPFAEGVVRRFNRRIGGNLYRAGLEAAGKRVGVSPEQTAQAARILGQFSDDLRIAQEVSDADLVSGKISPTEWREVHKNQGLLYRGALGAVRQFLPSAGQVLDPADFQVFREQVATVAGAMPDRRTRAQLLYAAWRSIPISELSPGIVDWETFFTFEEEFLEALSSDDRDLLVEWRRVGMTPTEKEWEEAKDTLRPYWEVGDDFAERFSLAPAEAGIWEEYQREQGQAKRQARQEAIGLIRDLERARTNLRNQLILENPSLETALLRWEFLTAPRTEAGQRFLTEAFPQQREPTATPTPVARQRRRSLVPSEQ